jgi:hypothetical protein
MTNASPEEQAKLPIIPDVTIQYRCGDNIQFSYMYGILPYTAFPSRIPANAKHIYVVSDHPTRALHAQVPPVASYVCMCMCVFNCLFLTARPPARPCSTRAVARASCRGYSTTSRRRGPTPPSS